MTRIITDDLETGSGTWDSSTSATVVTDIRAHGTYGVKLGSYGEIAWNISVGELYSRFYFFTSDDDQVLTLAGVRYSATIVGNIQRNASTKKLHVRLASTILETGSINIEENTWYCIEWYVKIASSGGRHVVKINGQTDIDYTGNTQGIYGTPTTFELYKSSTGLGNHWFDDIAVNDIAGGSDNSWIGRYPGINLLETLSDMTLAGTAEQLINYASLAETLANMTLAGTGTYLISGSLTKTLENMTSAAEVDVLAQASLDETLEGTYAASRELNSAIKRASAIQFLKPFTLALGIPGSSIDKGDRAILLHLYGFQSLYAMNASLDVTLQNLTLEALIAREGRVYGPAWQSG